VPKDLTPTGWRHRTIAGEESDDGDDPQLQVLEDLLFQMTLWLYSHKVLVPVEEYLVATASAPPPPPQGRLTIAEDDNTILYDSSTERKVDSNIRLDRLDNDALYQELLNMDLLNGDQSLLACSWRTGLEVNRLRAFALQHPHIRLVMRVPDETLE
jgi:hypothetical protein